MARTIQVGERLLLRDPEHHVYLAIKIALQHSYGNVFLTPVKIARILGIPSKPSLLVLINTILRELEKKGVAELWDKNSHRYLWLIYRDRFFQEVGSSRR